MALESHNRSLPPDSYFTGIENRNFLSPIGFKLSVDKLHGVDFFCQSASVPAISMGSADTGTRINKLRHPGDELNYEDLFIRFLVDENMKNWYQVHDWMREITTPVTTKEFTYNRGSYRSVNDPIPGIMDVEADEKVAYMRGDWTNQWKSDVSLFILSSNYRPVAEFVFRDAFPITLTTLNFDASVPDINYFTAEVTMRYNYFDYFIYPAAQATDASMKPNYQRTSLGNELTGK